MLITLLLLLLFQTRATQPCGEVMMIGWHVGVTSKRRYAVCIGVLRWSQDPKEYWVIGVILGNKYLREVPIKMPRNVGAVRCFPGVAFVMRSCSTAT